MADSLVPDSIDFLATWTHIFALLLLIPATVTLLLHFLAIAAALVNMNKTYNLNSFIKPESSNGHFSNHSKLPKVSIIKPIVTIDSTLKDNLASYFNMDYPVTHYEVLVCIENVSDPACELVESIMAAHPDVDATLFRGGTKIGVNPKINNINAAYEASKYEYILISDSSIYMRRDTLLDMSLHMISKPNIGIVHQMPFILPTCSATPNNLSPENRFCRNYQRVFFSTWHAKIYLSADVLGVNCITGMSCMMLKKILDGAGGLRAFSNYLAEDFFMAKTILGLNWKPAMASQPAWQNSPPVPLSSFRERLIRWSQLRYAMIPHTSPLEPFCQAFGNTLLVVLTTTFLFPDVITYPILFFLGYLLLWFFLDYCLFLSLHPSWAPHDMSIKEFAVTWFYRESITILEQIRSHSRSYINWHGRFYKLRWGGLTEEIASSTEKS